MRISLRAAISMSYLASHGLELQVDVSDAQRRVKVKVKVKVLLTLDIAPLRSESPPQKRSGMARVLSVVNV